MTLSFGVLFFTKFRASNSEADIFAKEASVCLFPRESPAALEAKDISEVPQVIPVPVRLMTAVLFQETKVVEDMVEVAQERVNDALLRLHETVSENTMCKS